MWEYMGNGAGFHGGGPFMLLFWLLLLGVVVAAVIFFLRGGVGGAAHRQATALELLEARYARGEIDTAEYRERRAELQEGMR